MGGDPHTPEHHRQASLLLLLLLLAAARGCLAYGGRRRRGFLVLVVGQFLQGVARIFGASSGRWLWGGAADGWACWLARWPARRGHGRGGWGGTELHGVRSVATGGDGAGFPVCVCAAFQPVSEELCGVRRAPSATWSGGGGDSGQSFSSWSHRVFPHVCGVLWAAAGESAALTMSVPVTTASSDVVFLLESVVLHPHYNPS